MRTVRRSTAVLAVLGGGVASLWLVYLPVWVSAWVVGGCLFTLGAIAVAEYLHNLRDRGV